MQRLKQYLLGFAGLAIIGLGLWGLFLVARWFWHVFIGLRPEIAAAMVAAVATVIVSVATVTVGKYLERRAEIEQELRRQKRPVYEDFIQLWFDILLGEKVGKKPTPEKELLSRLNGFTQSFLVWGSDDVIKEWTTMRLMFVGADSEDPESASPETLRQFGKVLAAIRRDIGHRNKGINEVTLLSLFINDAPQVLGAAK